LSILRPQIGFWDGVPGTRQAGRLRQQVTISEETRIGALKSAVNFLDQGIKIVTIVDGGHICTPTEFAMTIGRK
jgi:hypothetical protein